MGEELVHVGLAVSSAQKLISKCGFLLSRDERQRRNGGDTIFLNYFDVIYEPLDY